MTSDSKPPSGDRDAEVTAAYGRLSRELAGVLRATVGLLSIAYFVGWVRAKGFFSGLTFPWMTDDIQLLFIVRLAWLPALFLAFGIYLSFSDTARGFATKKDELVVVAVVGAGFLSSLCVALVGLIGGWWEMAEWGAMGSLLSSALVTGNQLGETVMARRASGFRWTSHRIHPLVVVSYAALVAAPGLLGMAQGMRAADPATSSLPYVTIPNSAETWRLIHAAGDRLYIGILRPKGPPLLRIVVAKEGMAIEARNLESRSPGPRSSTPPAARP